MKIFLRHLLYRVYHLLLGSFTYPDLSLKKMFEDFVGLSQGDGPWAEFYKPIPFYLYFNPARHYFSTESHDYGKAFEKIQA